MRSHRCTLTLAILVAIASHASAQDPECRELTILGAPLLDRVEIDPLTATDEKGLKFSGTATLFRADGSTLDLEVLRKLKSKKDIFKYKLKTPERTKPKCKVIAQVTRDPEEIVKVKLKYRGDERIKLKDPSLFTFGPCLPPAVVFLKKGTLATLPEVGARITRLIDLVPTIVDPAAAAQAGIRFEAPPGAPPNSYVYEIPEGHGTIRGTCSLSGDPTDIGHGFTGILNYQFDDGEGESGNGQFEFEVAKEGWRVWGSGTAAVPVLDAASTFTVPEEDPLVIDPDPTGDSNTCEADMQGTIEFELQIPTSIYSFVLKLISGERAAQILSQLFEPTGSDPEPLPDTMGQLPACEALDLGRWEGAWRLGWNCDGGSATGESLLTFTVSGPDTVRVTNEHPVGSGKVIRFTAKADPGDPNTLRGTFSRVDAVGFFWEDFAFTMQPNGETWSQSNTYEYADGSGSGTCGGSAQRQQ